MFDMTQMQQIETEQPTPDENKTPDVNVSEYISKWLDRIEDSKKFHEPAFKRMRKDILFAAGWQWDGQTPEDDRYVANIVQNLIRRRVSELYAKNPVFTATRRKRMDFQLWDENAGTLQAAMAAPGDPLNMALIQDIQSGMFRRRQIDGVCRTLEILFEHQLSEQQPNFKRQMKQMIVREETTGVGYLRLDFHRAMDTAPEIQGQINDYAAQLSRIEQMVSDLEDGTYEKESAEMVQLQNAIKSLEEQKYILVREGLQFSFPRSTAVIPDKNCTQLEGWLGARFIAEEFYMADDEIKRLYGIDMADTTYYYLPESDKAYNLGASAMVQKTDKHGKGLRCVYLVYDLDTMSCFVIAKGHDDYLQRPAAPGIQLERFFPYFAFTCNDREDELCIFPTSTVRLLMHPQREYNRSKEALRQHRIAMKPLYASAFGALSETDKGNMAAHEAHDCLELEGLNPGQPVDQLLQMVKKHAIDPNVYEVSTVFTDFQRIGGFQAADIGVTAGVTATESSLAEDANTSSRSSNADDLDDFLSAVALEAGHVLLQEMDIQTVRKIAGPGAVWPEIPDEEIINDIYLKIEAGSSGRPNKAAESASIQKLFPLLLQLPGANPEWVFKRLARSIDENVDIADAYIAGLPSIMAVNKTAAAPSNDPQQQGGYGGDNAEKPPGTSPGAQAPVGDDLSAQRTGGMMSGGSVPSADGFPQGIF